MVDSIIICMEFVRECYNRATNNVCENECVYVIVPFLRFLLLFFYFLKENPSPVGSRIQG